MVFILVSVFLDSVGIGIVLPVIPTLIRQLTGENLSHAAIYGGWLGFAYATMMFLFSPIMGNLSDRFGRRPVLLAAVLGLAFDYSLMAVAPGIAWLFLGRVLAGVAGSTYATANAYVADTTVAEKRAQSFGLVGAAFGAGFIVGPVIGGLLGQYGARIPFWAAAAVALLNFGYGLFVLPESLPADRRRAFVFKRANPLGAFMQMRGIPGALALLLVVFFIQFAGQTNPNIWAYYTMEKFHWNTAQIGVSLAIVGLLFIVVQGGLTRVLIPRVGAERAVYLGLFFGVITYIGFAFASTGTQMYIWLMASALSFLAYPAVQGIMSNRTPANAQGELQGAVGSIYGVTSIIGPPYVAFLFGYFSTGHRRYFPGAPYLSSAVLCLGALGIFALTLMTARRGMLAGREPLAPNPADH